MRILVLTSSYPTSDMATASAFLADWVQALATLGHTVHVLAPAPPAQGDYTTGSPQATVSHFGYAPIRRWQTLAYGAGMFDNVCRNPLRLLQLPSFLGAQYRSARRIAARCDIVHAHWFVPAGLVAAALNRVLRIPVVVSLHSTDYHLLRQLPGGRRLARIIAGRTGRLHFVTEYHRQRYLEWLGGGASSQPPAYVVPMGIPDAMSEHPSSSFRAEPVVGYMGRLIRLKGVDRLLTACARLGIRSVSVAGSGPALPDLKRLSRDLDLNVRFLSPVSGAAKTAFLDSCDILVFPSRHYRSGRSEGLPVAMLEALARGRIVVASDSGGIPEVVQHGENGYLFAAGDGRQLEQVLRGVLASWPPSGRIGLNAIATGRRFLASAVARVHEHEYRALTHPAGRREARP